jgi:hypothetical protein
MSAFGGKADIKRYCEESPLLTQNGHDQPIKCVRGSFIKILGCAATYKAIRSF